MRVEGHKVTKVNLKSFMSVHLYRLLFFLPELKGAAKCLQGFTKDIKDDVVFFFYFALISVTHPKYLPNFLDIIGPQRAPTLFKSLLFFFFLSAQRTVSRRAQGILVIITSSIEGSCQFLINLEMDLASSLPPQMFSVISLLSVSLAISLSVCPCSSVCTIFSFCVMASSSRSLPSHLALNEEEALIHNFDGVSLGNGPSSESYCLVVKIISMKNIKPDWLDKAMREAWTLRYPISFTEYHSGLFLAHFGCDGDRRRVIENQPWHFDHCLMVFANPEGFDLLRPEQLRFVPFWMQIHYIPFGFRSPSLAKMVADDIGDLIEIHKNTLLEISSPFLRIRVLLDISKPIRRGMQVFFRSLGRTKWLMFKYEGLQNYCYFCGKIDHIFSKCGSFLQSCDDGCYPPVLPFKENIRAPLKSQFKRDPFDLANSIPF
ncbi:hypothetical protein F8388_014237 [Cannabis sativa]|uniref:Zinc knuckle CX2CX4HX4C domain-containing protein n=1 Tax=Cannabis sativa TaxID=3483 RepID=A0A7J6GQ94_CANSA|nr:hypothetical protein F8388_014237 [Cannabis sativa]